MKKTVVISIIIAAIAALLAVAAVQTGIFRSGESAIPADGSNAETQDLKKLTAPQRLKMPKIQTIDRKKLMEGAKKMKERREKEAETKKTEESAE